MYYNTINIDMETPTAGGGGVPLCGLEDVPPKLEGESADEHESRVAKARAQKLAEYYSEVMADCTEHSAYKEYIAAVLPSIRSMHSVRLLSLVCARS